MPTYQQMAAILKSNGWQTLWSQDNWVKSCWLNDRSMNIDWAGFNTQAAYEECIKEIERDRAQASFDSSNKRNS